MSHEEKNERLKSVNDARYNYKLCVIEQDLDEGSKIVFTKEFNPADMFRFSQLMTDYSKADWYTDVLNDLSPFQQREIEAELDMLGMVSRYQTNLIRLALKTTKGNKSHAAKLLKIKRTTLLSLMARLNIELETPEVSEQFIKHAVDKVREFSIEKMSLQDIESSLVKAKNLIEKLNSKKNSLQKSNIIPLKRAVNES